MSYEGFDEYICEVGHYSTYDSLECAYGNEGEICGCGKPIRYTHMVDETNGYDEENPTTFSAKKKEKAEFETNWHTDFLGNKYATKRVLYEPDSSEWRTVANLA